MKLDESQRINDYFRANLEDWTPPAAMGEARVLYVPISLDPEIVRSCSTILSEGELEKADTFLTGEHKNHFILRRSFRRVCAQLAVGSSGQPLSQLLFEETEEGRPYLRETPGLWFSFSSFRFGFLGSWSFTRGVGVDIEDQTQNLETSEVAEQFFSEAEAEMIDRARGIERSRDFFRLWSLKESALKSIGEGLPFGLDAFGFQLSPELRVNRAPEEYGGPGCFHPHLIDRNGTCAALVTHLK